MEDIRKNLREDYNISVERFNAKDYKNFFRNIRPATEWLSKLLIFDFMRDDDLARQLIKGEKSFELQQSRTFKIKDGNNGHTPAGKNFPTIFPKAFVYRHPEYVSVQANNEQKRIARGIRGCGDELARYYDIASGFGNHTNENILKPDIQAAGFVAFIYSFFDYLKRWGSAR